MPKRINYSNWILLSERKPSYKDHTILVCNEFEVAFAHNDGRWHYYPHINGPAVAWMQLPLAYGELQRRAAIIKERKVARKQAIAEETQFAKERRTKQNQAIAKELKAKRMNLQQEAPHNRAKLTRAQADAIRIDTRKGVVIAKEYGVTTATVCDIRALRTWQPKEKLSTLENREPDEQI